MAKTKEIVKAQISFGNRGNVQTMVLPHVNEILGVEFDEELALRVMGIDIFVGNKYTTHFGAPREPNWQGAVVKLSFRDADYHEVSRKLHIPTTGEIDASKLRAKWVEMLGLKAYDDDLKVQRATREAENDIKVTALWSGVSGVNMDGVFSAKAKPGGFEVELRGVTPEQLKKIAAVMGGGGQ